jgi:hypothetical protein
VAFFVTDAPAKCIPLFSLLPNSDKFPIFWFFHTDCHLTQSLIHWHEHYRV